MSECKKVENVTDMSNCSKAILLMMNSELFKSGLLDEDTRKEMEKEILYGCSFIQ